MHYEVQCIVICVTSCDRYVTRRDAPQALSHLLSRYQPQCHSSFYKERPSFGDGGGRYCTCLKVFRGVDKPWPMVFDNILRLAPTSGKEAVRRPATSGNRLPLSESVETHIGRRSGLQQPVLACITRIDQPCPAIRDRRGTRRTDRHTGSRIY